MGLVGHATFGGDITQRPVRREHQALRPLHPAPDDVGVRGLAHAVVECNGEVEGAEASDRGKIFVSE